MQRRVIAPRAEWQKLVEDKGMAYHTIDGEPYWDESTCYEFTAAEIDQIEKATYELNDMCLKAVDHVLSKKLFDRFAIPAQFADYIARSWETDELTIYGRFDLFYDGSGPPKLLEYNADTPTALLEAAVIQWYWLQDFAAGDKRMDQFNSIHERLIEAWGVLKGQMGGKLYFSAMDGYLEDFMTVNYLRDTAIQAGIETDYINVEDIGWEEKSNEFTDLQNTPMWNIFKLYPWEWLVRDQFGEHLLLNKTRWFEPPWKTILSNKAILPMLWELFPDSPYLLRAAFDPFGDSYIKKPIHSREGANISIVRYGVTQEQTEGPYEGPFIYQDLAPLKSYAGNYPIIGSWIVNGYACGIGIREDAKVITGNTSRFIPHYFVRGS